MLPIDTVLPELWVGHVLPSTPFPTLTRALLAMTCRLFAERMRSLPRMPCSSRKRHPIWVDWRDPAGANDPIRARCRTMALCIFTGPSTLAHWALVEPDWEDGQFSFNVLMAAIAVDSVALVRHIGSRVGGMATLVSAMSHLREREVQTAIGRFGAFRVLEFLREHKYVCDPTRVSCTAIKYGVEVPLALMKKSVKYEDKVFEALLLIGRRDTVMNLIAQYPPEQDLRLASGIAAARIGHVEYLKECIEVHRVDSHLVICAAACHPDSVRYLVHAYGQADWNPQAIADFTWRNVPWLEASPEALDLLVNVHPELTDYSPLPSAEAIAYILDHTTWNQTGVGALDWLIAFAQQSRGWPGGWPDLDHMFDDGVREQYAGSLLHYVIKRGCPVTIHTLTRIRARETATAHYFADWIERIRVSAR